MTEAFYTSVRQWGNDLLYIGYDENGNRIQEKIQHKPQLYVVSTQNNPTAQSIEGIPLHQIEFDSIKEAKDYIKNYSTSQQIYGIDKFNYEYITRTFRNDVAYDIRKMRILYIDIEVYSGNGFPDPFSAYEEITCLTIKDVKFDTFHVWTNTKWGEFNSKKLEHINDNINIVHHEFDNEYDMLKDMISWYTLNSPDILSGWYSRDFDIPYTYNRLSRVLGASTAKKLSPWSIVREKTSQVKRFGQMTDQKTYEIYGVSEIDYLDLYKKYTYTTSESFALDFIANKELGVGKIQYEGSLTELLTTDYQKYVEYNIIDVARIHQIDQKVRFLDQLLEVSYAGKVASCEDALGTVKFWEILIYNHLYDKGEIAELKDRFFNEKEQYAGGYVKEPIGGMYRWVMSFDLTSLYPKIMQQVNIGSETHIDDSLLPRELLELRAQATPDRFVTETIDTSALKTFDVSMSGNGQFYTRQKPSFLAELMDKFFNKRKVYKTEMFKCNKTGDKEGEALYNSKQLAIKILINSAYGACGNNFFQYYSLENAEAVTLTGQIVIRFIEKHLNQYLQNLLGDDKDRIIAIDTDSVYVNFEDVVNAVLPDETDNIVITEFLDKVAKEKIEPFIKDRYNDLFNMMNHYENHMNMDREVIADKAVWTKKKRYFMNAYDIEGKKYYDDPYIKVMGIEVVKSSTPKVARDALKDCLRIILREDENALIAYVTDFKKRFRTMTPEEIGSPSSVNNIEEYVDVDGGHKLGTPYHVKGAIAYNNLLKEHNLELVYETIKSGNKIKHMYLREPNIIMQKDISFVDRLPKQFDLDKYIDYEKQFDKVFLKPLKLITDLIDWKTEYVNTLM